WNIYKMNTSHTKGFWENFMKPFSLKARVEGSEELEAEITSLRFLKRLSSKEQEEALRGLFVAYINTSTYIPATDEIPATTTTIALPQILDSYKNADASLQGRMGAAVWWALIKVDPSKDKWQSVLRELKPIAIKGYSDGAYRPFYDKFLGFKDLMFDKIVSGP